MENNYIKLLLSKIQKKKEISYTSCDQSMYNGSSINFASNPLSANITKWSNTLKQFVGKLPTNCLSVFNHFVRLALKKLISK